MDFSHIPQLSGNALSSGARPLPPGAQAHEDEKALSSGEAATLGRIGSLLDGVIADEASEPPEAGEPNIDPRLSEARSLTQALINSSSF